MTTVPPFYDPTLAVMCDALQAMCPGAEFTISSGGYDTLIWHDTVQSKPTEAQFNAAVAEQMKAQANGQR